MSRTCASALYAGYMSNSCEKLERGEFELCKSQLYSKYQSLVKCKTLPGCLSENTFKI